MEADYRGASDQDQIIETVSEAIIVYAPDKEQSHKAWRSRK